MLDIALAPMALPLKEFTVGDTIRVTVSFKYAVAVDTTVTIKAGPYYRDFFGTHMVGTCVGQTDVPLTATTTLTPQTADVDFLLIPKATGGIDNGTYGLRVWVEDTDAMSEQDNIIIVSGNASGGLDLSGILPMVMMLMMMGMIMPMVQQTGEGA